MCIRDRHYARDCRTNPPQVKGLRPVELSALRHGRDGVTELGRLIVEVTVTTLEGNKTIKVLVDSGAEKNVINERFRTAYRMLIEGKPGRGHAIDGRLLYIYRQVEATIALRNSKGEENIIRTLFESIAIDTYDIILGFP